MNFTFNAFKRLALIGSFIVMGYGLSGCASRAGARSSPATSQIGPQISYLKAHKSKRCQVVYTINDTTTNSEGILKEITPDWVALSDVSVPAFVGDNPKEINLKKEFLIPVQRIVYVSFDEEQ